MFPSSCEVDIHSIRCHRRCKCGHRSHREALSTMMNKKSPKFPVGTKGSAHAQIEYHTTQAIKARCLPKRRLTAIHGDTPITDAE